jgi:hypothetical protein
MNALKIQGYRKAGRLIKKDYYKNNGKPVKWWVFKRCFTLEIYHLLEIPLPDSLAVVFNKVWDKGRWVILWVSGLLTVIFMKGDIRF